MGLYVGGKVGPIGYSKSLTGGGGGTRTKTTPTTDEEVWTLQVMLSIWVLATLIAAGIGWLVDGKSGAGAGAGWVGIVIPILLLCIGWTIMMIVRACQIVWGILEPPFRAIRWLWRKAQVKREQRDARYALYAEMHEADES